MRFLSRSNEPWTLDEVVPPLGKSLLAHVESLLPPSGRGPLPDGGEPLPDDPPPTEGWLSWAAGALDGVLADRVGGSNTGNEPLAAAAAVSHLLRNKADAARVHTAVERLVEVGGPRAMDRFVAALFADRRLDKARLATFARWVCQHETRREAVKAGMALLGVSGTPNDAALIVRLGLLEELTLYAVVALANLLEQPEPAIFDLAQQVRSWGRIHAVRRLAGSTNAEVQRWLIRGGAANDVMPEEIAFVAATTGHLRKALEGVADDDLLDHGGELLRALAAGGPAEDMCDYPDGAAAMRAYAVHMTGASATPRRLECLVFLERYLEHWAADNPHMGADEREALRSQFSAVLDRPRWREAVEQALASDDLFEVQLVATIAGRFGVDAGPALEAWLARQPHTAHLWQSLVATAEDQRLRDVLKLAEDLLPVSALANGPAEDLGLGTEYDADNCLRIIVQRLEDAPGEGWPLVQASLGNRVIGVRNCALRALAAWPRDTWPDDAEEALRTALWREPSDDVRKSIRELLDA